MKIKRLSIKDWNQFGDLDIEFHPKLTVLTGANGTGKSTIIRLISNMIGWHYQETAVPSKEETGIVGFLTGISLKRLFKTEEVKAAKIGIGKIEFEQGSVNLSVPNKTESPSYNVLFDKVGGDSSLRGVFIPSHRVPYSYKKVDSIPVKPMDKKEAFDLFHNAIKKITINAGFYNPVEESPTLHLKSTLMSLAIFGRGNEFVKKNDEAYDLFLGFIEVLKKLLPQTLGFQGITIQDGEIVLVTNTGNFLIDSVSGGIGSLIDLAWQIYMFDDGGSSFIVITDEPENHLHPTMQRSLLPNLLEAFPDTQFILATHSPFVVSSVMDSYVYAFKYDESNKIYAEKLDFENKAGNASEVLRDVLGVPVTLPIWVEDQLEDIVKEFREKELTAESYKALKEGLKLVGLEEYLPQALGSISMGN